MGKRADQARGVWCCQVKTMTHLAGRLHSRFRGAEPLGAESLASGVFGPRSFWPQEFLPTGFLAGVDVNAIMTVSPARSWLMAA